MFRIVNIVLVVFIQFVCRFSVLGQNCPGPLYKTWCPDKPNHILCASNDTKLSSVQNTDDALIRSYSNQFKRNELCNQINNGRKKLFLVDYLSNMAVRALIHGLWYKNDVCFATRLHQNVRVVHYHPLQSDTETIDELTSLMNIKGFGCANDHTDLLCLFSDHDPFKDFQQYMATDDRYCGIEYAKFYESICYLNDTTAFAIINQVKNVKRVDWDNELEYLAQGSVASNTSNICYTKDQRKIKLSPINMYVGEIDYFSVANIVQRMIENGDFEVLKDSENYKIGCTFYDLQETSLRVLCLYDTVTRNDISMYPVVASHEYLKSIAHDNTYVIYGLIILLFANIIIILICIRIVCKFRSQSEDAIYGDQPIYSTPQ